MVAESAIAGSISIAVVRIVFEVQQSDSHTMRPLVFVVILFVAMVVDIAANNGFWTHRVVTALRTLGLH
jgi:hypothetical protein